MKPLYILSFLAILLSNSTVGQDLHFSQYESLPPLLNPALTGFMSGNDETDLRVGVIHRNQWSSFLGDAAFSTTGASFDMSNCFPSGSDKRQNSRSHKSSNPTWGLGLGIIHDESGVLSVKDITNKGFALHRTHIQSSLSILMPFYDKLFVGGGFRFGGILHRLRTEHLRFDEQFDGVAGFDPNIVGEFDDQSVLNATMFDIGGGLSALYLDDDFASMAGIAIDHIIVPVAYDWMISPELPQLSRKFSAHLKMSIALKSWRSGLFGINPRAILLVQSPHQQLLSGADFFFRWDHGSAVTIGGGWRATRTVDAFREESILLGLGYIVDNFRFSFSYDINQSTLRAVSRRYGALEFSMTYQWKKQNGNCPALSGCDQEVAHAIFY
ncbi:MAG: PorP/SprF family type IX secretion system membrane protein [Bacteroidota bacterium]